jgi:membrane protein
MIPTLLGNLERWLFEPPESIYGRPLWKLTRILRYPYALIRDILRGDLTLRGMSLVYTTLLSVVPLIAVMFSVLKGLGYHRELEPVLYTFLEPLGERGYQLTSQIMTFVDNVRGDVLGAVGVIFLLYTTLSMIQKVEEAFNFVWRVAQPRSLMRRVSEYLSVMVIGPAVIVAAFGLIASFAHSSGAQAVAKYEPVGTVLAVFGRLTPYVLVTGVFTFLYGFMPNTKVRFRAALIGGVFAGVVWAATGMIFTSFVITSTRNIVIYASFAIVIVALIWLHVSWLILLLGAQLSFYVQNPQYLRPGPGEIQLNASADHRWNTNRLAEHLELPGAGINPILNALERAKLLLAAEDETWVPGRDPQAIELIEVLEAVRHDAAGPRLARIRDIAPAVAAARAAEEAMRKSLKGRTLNDLVEQESAKSQAKA